MCQISRTHLIGYIVEDGITSSVHAKHTFSRTSIMLRNNTQYVGKNRYDKRYTVRGIIIKDKTKIKQNKKQKPRAAGSRTTEMEGHKGPR